MLELNGGDVDGDRDGLGPCDGLLAGLPQDPTAQIDDQPGLFGQRDEFCRRDEAKIGVLPAHEGFGTHNVTGAQVNLRLKDEAQLVAADRLAQVPVQLAMSVHGQLICRTETANGHPRGPGLDDCGVGLIEQVCTGAGAGCITGHDFDMQIVPIDAVVA